MWPFQTISPFQVQFHPVQIKPDCFSIVYVPDYWTWSALLSPHCPFFFLLTLKHRSRCLVASQQIPAAGRQMDLEQLLFLHFCLCTDLTKCQNLVFLCLFYSSKVFAQC